MDTGNICLRVSCLLPSFWGFFFHHPIPDGQRSSTQCMITDSDGGGGSILEKMHFLKSYILISLSFLHYYMFQITAWEYLVSFLFYHLKQQWPLIVIHWDIIGALKFYAFNVIICLLPNNQVSGLWCWVWKTVLGHFDRKNSIIYKDFPFHLWEMVSP